MVKAQALFSRKWLGEVPVFGLGQAGPVILNDSNFSQVLSAPKAVVDFWSPTCPYCMTYKPVFEEVAASSPGVLMATANTNETPISAGQYGISSIPATIFFTNGKEVGRVEGSMSKQDLQAEMARVFAAGTPVAGGAMMPAAESQGSLGLVLGGLALAGIVAGTVYLVTRR